MAQVVRPYRGVSADERRADRRARLVEAALDVIGSEGIARMTMTAVCARAGLTERYFYESFRGRDELLAAVFDEFSGAADEQILGRVAAAPPDLLERCRAAVGALIEILTDDPRKARAFAEGIGNEALKEQRERAVELYAGALALEMRSLAGIDDDRLAPAVRVATLTLVAGTAEVVTHWLDGDIDLSRDELIEVSARMCVAAANSLAATHPR